MAIDIDIQHVARLARLDLSPAELEVYSRQLGQILEHAARVQSLEGAPSQEPEHPLGLVNTWRQDVVTPSLPRDQVLSQAPESEDGYFVAPPALDAE